MKKNKDYVNNFLNLKNVIRILGIEYILSEKQIENLRKYFDIFGYRKSQDRFSRLAYFILQGVEDFIEREEKLLLNDRMSIEYFRILYGDVLGEERWNNNIRNIKSFLPSRTEFWMNKGFTESEAKEKVRMHQCAASAESAKVFSRSNSIRCEEFWIDHGKTKEEATQIISNIQRRDKEFFVSKYGEKEGTRKYKISKKRRKNTWKMKDKKAHGLKTLPKTFNIYGQEYQAIHLFLEQNNIDTKYCMFGAPIDQFYQWIPNTGFRRYDLAIFEDIDKTKLKLIMEYHGPGHINFSDYDSSMKDKIFVINGKEVKRYGTYGRSYANDLIKRNHIMEKHPDVQYYVFWNRDLENKDFEIK